MRRLPLTSVCEVGAVCLVPGDKFAPLVYFAVAVVDKALDDIRHRKVLRPVISRTVP